MHVLLVGPEFEENLSLRYLAAALRQAGHTASLARFDSPEYLEGVVQQVRREQPHSQAEEHHHQKVAHQIRQIGHCFGACWRGALLGDDFRRHEDGRCRRAGSAVARRCRYRQRQRVAAHARPEKKWYR